ncbi:conserved Plasmodium protein, unknown function [Plasmodium ovale]|uniref:Protein kinase domain-containing protein n=1 Tax=Plasmodium ovale TaxID=36330 RepID=A0A1C3L4V2_PLAOA|nr:conserved Plasmodium protein, unknown function [Plasmodium ovale]
MKFIYFMKKLFILNAVIFTINNYTKKKNCNFSFFIYSLKIKSFQNRDLNDEEGKTGEVGNTSTHLDDDASASYIKFDSANNSVGGSSVGDVNVNNSDVGSTDVSASEDSDVEIGDRVGNSGYKQTGSGGDQEWSDASTFSQAGINLNDKLLNKETQEDKKENDDELKEYENIPIIYTSIDDIKTFSYVKGKLKLVYIRSFYDNNQKELYEGKFQFFRNNIIYVTTFAVVRNSLKDEINHTEKWYNAYMKVLQKNNYNITVRCNGKVETFYGSISFNQKELQNFEILRKWLKNRLNITYDYFLYNLNTFYSAKRKYLEYINFRFANPDIITHVHTKKMFPEFIMPKINYEEFIKLSPFDRMKYVSYRRMKNNYNVICDLEKDLKKTEDRFVLYNVLRDNIIESEETQEVIIFETSDKGIFTYDSKHSKDIKILSTNFEIEFLMDENGYKNETDKYFYLNEYNPVHLELQNEGVIKYDFVNTWLSKYFINSQKYKKFYFYLYISKHFDSMDKGLYDVNFYSPQYYSFVEKGVKNYVTFIGKNENKNESNTPKMDAHTYDTLTNVYNKEPGTSKEKRKIYLKSHERYDNNFRSKKANKFLGTYNLWGRKKKKKIEHAHYMNRNSVFSFIELGTNLTYEHKGSPDNKKDGNPSDNKMVERTSTPTMSHLSDNNNISSSASSSTRMEEDGQRKDADKGISINPGGTLPQTSIHYFNDDSEFDDVYSSILKKRENANLNSRNNKAKDGNIKNSTDRSTKYDNAVVKNTNLPNSSKSKETPKTASRSEITNLNEQDKSFANPSYLFGVLGYMKKVKDMFYADEESAPVGNRNFGAKMQHRSESTSERVAEERAAAERVAAERAAEERAAAERAAEEKAISEKNASETSTLDNSSFESKVNESNTTENNAIESSTLDKSLSQSTEALPKSSFSYADLYKDYFKPLEPNEINTQIMWNQEMSSSDHKTNDENSLSEEKKGLYKDFKAEEMNLPREKEMSDDSIPAFDYSKYLQLLNLEKEYFSDKGHQSDSFLRNDENYEHSYETGKYSYNHFYHHPVDNEENYVQPEILTSRGGKSSSDYFTELSSHDNNKYIDLKHIDDKLKDKIYDKYENSSVYKDILEKDTNRILVGIAERGGKDMFILNWLSGDNILCVIKSKYHEKLFYNMVNDTYFKVLNVFKHGNENRISIISKDSKGLVIDANFYPHYSTIKLFFNDKKNSNVFEEEIKSYILLVHFLLNSNNSPCKNYKNIKYFYSEDTFNVSHVDYINNKLLELVSECAFEMLNWNIPTGVVRKHESYLNTSIFNRAEKYVHRSIYHYGFKLRILKGKDAVKFAMSTHKLMDNNYNIKYDIFLKIASELFYLQSFGLLHRNVKADNYVTLKKKDTENKYVEILLRGFTDVIEEGSYGKFSGSPIYASPEKLKSYFSSILYNLKSDVFSLGLSLSTIFLKENFFLKNIERKMKFPVEKYAISVLRRNPMVQLWIKSVNPFMRKRFDIFKSRSYLKVSVHALEKRLSKKWIYNWFKGKSEFISYSGENNLHTLFIRTLNGNIRGWNSDSSIKKSALEKDYDTCFFHYTNKASTERVNNDGMGEQGGESSEDKSFPMSFCQLGVRSKYANSAAFSDESGSDSDRDSDRYSDSDRDRYSDRYSDSKSSDYQSDKLGRKSSSSDSSSDYMDIEKQHASNISKHGTKEYSKKMNNKLLQILNNEEENVHRIPFGNKIENDIDYSKLDKHNMQTYVNACYNFKNGVIGTAMKTFSIEFEKYRPDIFDMYLLLKKKLTHLKDKDDNIRNTLYILQGFSEPDIKKILKDNIYGTSYHIKKMTILKSLLFYGYFSIYERLSYEFKLYELQHFPLSEQNKDTFESVVITCMLRDNFNELSHLLLAQHIYDNYQKGTEYTNIFVNLYTVNDTVYFIDTKKITNLINRNIKNRFKNIDFKKEQNFLLYMKKKSMQRSTSFRHGHELSMVPLRPSYDSIHLMSYENKLPFIGTFVIKIDSFTIRDMNINLATLLNNSFWNLKNKCKCVNYTHMQVEYGKNITSSEYNIKDTRVDLHKPIGTLLKDLVKEESSFSDNKNDQFNVHTFKPLNIHLDVILRNSLHLIDKKILVKCAKKLKKHTNTFMPTVSHARKNETVKIKIGLGPSTFFYLSFNISLLRSQNIFLKNIIYFIHKYYNSKMNKNVANFNIGGVNNRQKFNCQQMNEHNTFFYNNTTKSIIKETSFNKVLSALYNIDFMEPSYVIKAALNYYNHRDQDGILLSLVTICSVIYKKEKKAGNTKEFEYFLEPPYGIYSEEHPRDLDNAAGDNTGDVADGNKEYASVEDTGVVEDNTGYSVEDKVGDVAEGSRSNVVGEATGEDRIKISKKDYAKLRRGKNVIKATGKNVNYYYGTVECLHFLNKKVISFFNDNNTTNVFEQLVIPSAYIFVSKKKTLKNGDTAYITETVDFSIVSDIMNLQKYENEMYTLSDFMHLILQWLTMDKPYDTKNKCNFLSHKKNNPEYDMVLGVTTESGRKHILYENNEGLVKFLFYNILKNQEFNQYTTGLLMSAIKLHNLKIYFLLKDELSRIFPGLGNPHNKPEEGSNKQFVSCLKQLKGKNVTLLGGSINQEMYIPLSLKFLNKNIVYTIPKDTFKKLIYNFSNNKVDAHYRDELFTYTLSPITEIENKLRHLFLADLRHYVDIPNELINNDKLFLVTMNKTFYESLREKCSVHRINCLNDVEEIIFQKNSSFTEQIFIVKNVMSYFLRAKIRGVLNKMKYRIIR